jgi:plasmid fertility inhibition factor
MSWLEDVDTTTGTAVFGVTTTTGVQYMKLRREESDAYAVVDVDAQRFLALWRAHPESYTHDVACGTPATWPGDAKWHHAVDAFGPGRANPVPLAIVWLSPAFERVQAPWWPPHWGRGTVVRDLGCMGAGFTDGVTRTIWLLTYGAPSFPVLVRAENADELHRLAGFAGRGPVAPGRFFVSPRDMPEWPTTAANESAHMRTTPNDEVAKPLHAPLLSALSKFKRAAIPAGTLLFHGGRSKSPHADPVARKLTGTRKWFSEDAEYAVSYSFVDGDQYGTPLLWVCRARHDIAALQGSQYGLLQSQPWGPAFPGTFPSQFVDYAGAILGSAGPFALLDHHDGERYQEVLMTSPEDATHVVELIELPHSKAAAEQLARERFGPDAGGGV